jgi:DNA-directed RNA polymerase subunit RPC12/RpoP
MTYSDLIQEVNTWFACLACGFPRKFLYVTDHSISCPNCNSRWERIDNIIHQVNNRDTITQEEYRTRLK